LLKPKESSRLVFIPLIKTEYQGQTLFGDYLWFQLDKEDPGYRISAIVEDFALGP
jgi:hypothetical protein